MSVCRGMTVNSTSAAWRNADKNENEKWKRSMKTTKITLCRKCRSPLIPDEIAMTKKLINRGTEVFYCLDCLAQAFDVERGDLERKILEFKEGGCTLFV